MYVVQLVQGLHYKAHRAPGQDCWTGRQPGGASTHQLQQRRAYAAPPRDPKLLEFLQWARDRLQDEQETRAARTKHLQALLRPHLDPSQRSNIAAASGLRVPAHIAAMPPGSSTSSSSSGSGSGCTQAMADKRMRRCPVLIKERLHPLRDLMPAAPRATPRFTPAFMTEFRTSRDPQQRMAALFSGLRWPASARLADAPPPFMYAGSEREVEPLVPQAYWSNAAFAQATKRRSIRVRAPSAGPFESGSTDINAMKSSSSSGDSSGDSSGSGTRGGSSSNSSSRDRVVGDVHRRTLDLLFPANSSNGGGSSSDGVVRNRNRRTLDLLFPTKAPIAAEATAWQLTQHKSGSIAAMAARSHAASLKPKHEHGSALAAVSPASAMQLSGAQDPAAKTLQAVQAQTGCLASLPAAAKHLAVPAAAASASALQARQQAINALVQESQQRGSVLRLLPSAKSTQPATQDPKQRQDAVSTLLDSSTPPKRAGSLAIPQSHSLLDWLFLYRLNKDMREQWKQPFGGWDWDNPLPFDADGSMIVLPGHKGSAAQAGAQQAAGSDTSGEPLVAYDKWEQPAAGMGTTADPFVPENDWQKQAAAAAAAADTYKAHDDWGQSGAGVDATDDPFESHGWKKPASWVAANGNPLVTLDEWEEHVAAQAATADHPFGTDNDWQQQAARMDAKGNPIATDNNWQQQAVARAAEADPFAPHDNWGPPPAGVGATAEPSFLAHDWPEQLERAFRIERQRRRDRRQGLQLLQQRQQLLQQRQRRQRQQQWQRQQRRRCQQASTPPTEGIMPLEMRYALNMHQAYNPPAPQVLRHSVSSSGVASSVGSGTGSSGACGGSSGGSSINTTSSGSSITSGSSSSSLRPLPSWRPDSGFGGGGSGGGSGGVTGSTVGAQPLRGLLAPGFKAGGFRAGAGQALGWVAAGLLLVALVTLSKRQLAASPGDGGSCPAAAGDGASDMDSGAERVAGTIGMTAVDGSFGALAVGGAMDAAHGSRTSRSGKSTLGAAMERQGGQASTAARAGGAAGGSVVAGGRGDRRASAAGGEESGSTFENWMEARLTATIQQFEQEEAMLQAELDAYRRLPRSTATAADNQRRREAIAEQLQSLAILRQALESERAQRRSEGR